MSCRPYPGKRQVDCWNYQNEWFTNCRHMKRTRFRQIRSCLHWCDNETSANGDTLYKVRPMINILLQTLGMYVNVGEGIALDETCIGLYHAHAKALTFYNPAKPRGKHHCKLYVVCENTHCDAINFKFAHRTYKKSKEDNDNEKLEYNNKLASTKKKKELCTKQYDPSDNELEDEDDEDVDDENEKDVPKMVNLVCTLCEMLRGTGVVVNMDNLYSSPEVFIRLKEMGIYARGTFRKNRKYYLLSFNSKI